MERIVSECGSCPFSWYADGTRCKLTAGPSKTWARGRPLKIDLDDPVIPKWCPLRRSPATVRLSKKIK